MKAPDPNFISAAFHVIATLAATVGIPVAALLLSRQQNHKSWLERLDALQIRFWNDPGMAQTRAALATSDPEDRLARTLRARSSGAFMSAEDYEPLEHLDRFLALLEQARITSEELPAEKKKAWRDLFFGYWLSRASGSGRADVVAYVAAYYPSLASLRNGEASPSPKLANGSDSGPPRMEG
jgi:hypothetical protein